MLAKAGSIALQLSSRSVLLSSADYSSDLFWPIGHFATSPGLSES